jgi:hypothetical protein
VIHPSNQQLATMRKSAGNLRNFSRVGKWKLVGDGAAAPLGYDGWRRQSGHLGHPVPISKTAVQTGEFEV